MHYDEPWPHDARPFLGAKSMNLDEYRGIPAADKARLMRALRRMCKAHDTLVSDTEGQYPPLDPGCNDCTQGCTPMSHDTGLCPYHGAQALLHELDRRAEALQDDGP